MSDAKVTVEGKDVPLETRTVRVAGKTCRQALNEHGFEIGLFDAATLAEVVVPERPALGVAAKDSSDEPVKTEAVAGQPKDSK